MSARKAGLRFILVTLFLDVLGIGLIIPILPNLVKGFVNGDTEAAADWFGTFASAYAVMQFTFSPILGSLSDRFGRRPVLLTAVTGQGIDYLLMGFAPGLWWLFVGRLIAGLTGASIGTATAYIADVSPPEKRAANFGLLGIAFGLGFIIGPLAGGLLGEWNLRAPFFAAAALALTNALYGFFVLPESLGAENRRAFSWARANPLGTFAGLKKYPLVLSMALTIFLVNLAQRCLESTWVLSTGYRYGWGPRSAAISLAVVGLCAAVVQGGLVRRIVPALGERRVITLGLLISVMAFTGYGFSTEGWMVYVVLPFGALAGMAGPAAQGLLSRAVPANEQGMLQGGLSGLTSLTSIIGPLFATQLFSFFISARAPMLLPGASFFAGALFVLAALLFAVRTFAKYPGETQPQGEHAKRAT